MIKPDDVKFSKYLSYLLRHHPESIGVAIDHQGWVSVQDLIDKINANEDYEINRTYLEFIVDIDAMESKGRYQFNGDHTKIRACQGHSIPGIDLGLVEAKPPASLCHGTTIAALIKILNSGTIKKMKRHAVHMSDNSYLAMQSAQRWHIPACIIEINTDAMHRDGYKFNISANGVWLTESVPVKYFEKVIFLH